MRGIVMSFGQENVTIAARTILVPVSRHIGYEDVGDKISDDEAKDFIQNFSDADLDLCFDEELANRVRLGITIAGKYVLISTKGADIEKQNKALMNYDEQDEPEDRGY